MFFENVVLDCKSDEDVAEIRVMVRKVLPKLQLERFCLKWSSVNVGSGNQLFCKLYPKLEPQLFFETKISNPRWVCWFWKFVFFEIVPQTRATAVIYSEKTVLKVDRGG